MSHNLYFILNNRLIVETINQESADMLGFSIDQLEGMKLAELLPSNSQKAIRRIIRWYQQTEEPSLEQRIPINKDETRSLLQAHFFRLESRKILACINFIPEAEFSANLGDGTSLWNMFAQTLDCGLLNLDDSLRIRNISESFISLADIRDSQNVLLSKNALVAQSLSDFLSTKKELSILFENLVAIIDVASSERKASKSEIFSYKGKHLQFVCGPIIDLGTLSGYGIYLYNLTTIIQQEREMAESRAQVSELSRLSSLGEMAGGIAHEINNPLAVILGAVMILRRTQAKSEISSELLNKQLENIDSMGKRISKIIESMRRVSRNSSSDDFISLTWQDLIDEIEPLAKIRVTKAKVKLEFQIEKEIRNMSLTSQGVQISQIIVNLINNAVDAVKGSEKPWIHVTLDLDSEQETYQLRVIDSGKGISEEVLLKIFDPFFTTKTVGTGTGLGLSIAKRIAMNHGGDLNYEPGDNTTFCLSLPIAFVPNIEDQNRENQ